MKTFGEILSTVKKYDLVNAIVSNVSTSEPDMAHFRECIIEDLNDLVHIAPITNSSPPILWPYIREGHIDVNVVNIYKESLFGKYDVIVKICCEPLIEHLAGRDETETKKERLASILGMHVNTDSITENELLCFVAIVLDNILPDDMVFSDFANYEVPKEEQIKLTRRRIYIFELFFDAYSPYLTPRFDGVWQYSTAGLSCVCSWTWNKESVGCKKDLKGKVFGDGSLLALNAPPRCVNGKWEWLCQCQIHDVSPKYFRITKLENGTIKGCGCHGGSKPKRNNDLADKQIGCIRVLNDVRTNGNRPELRVRCIVCGREKWVRAENLRKHVGIGCHCMPALNDRTVGTYYVLDAKERRNNEGLPEMLCERENGAKVWVRKEKLLHTLAKELIAKERSLQE